MILTDILKRRDILLAIFLIEDAICSINPDHHGGYIALSAFMTWVFLEIFGDRK